MVWRAVDPLAHALVVIALSGACALQPPPLQRAALLAERGEQAEAIALLEHHLSEHEAAHSARRMLIRLYGSIGQVDAARRQTERLAELLPAGSPIPWIELGHSLELAHDYAAALAAYDEAAAANPANPAGSRHGGLRAARWGELGLAEPRLEEAVRRDPSDSEAWHALGLVRVGLGKLEAAATAYSAGLSADPEALENRLGLATVALSVDRPAMALQHYNAIIAARPRLTDALLGRSWSLVLLGRWDEADRALDDAVARGANAAVVERQREAIRQRRADPGAVDAR
jgi:tetratricopeptide (TPR) repeat protein